MSDTATNPDGMYTPDDYYNVIGSNTNRPDALNKKAVDAFRGNLEAAKQYRKRTRYAKATQDQFGNALPDTAYEYIMQRLNQYRERGNVNKFSLRTIEYEAKSKYNIPSSFDISGSGLTDRALAKLIDQMPKPKAQTQTQPASNTTDGTAQSASTTNTGAGTSSGSGSSSAGLAVPAPKGVAAQSDETKSAYYRIKAGQASDADINLFMSYSDDELKAAGFGPKTIAYFQSLRNKKAQPQTQTSPGVSPRIDTSNLTEEQLRLLNPEERSLVENMSLAVRINMAKAQGKVISGLSKPAQWFTSLLLDPVSRKKYKEAIAKLEAKWAGHVNGLQDAYYGTQEHKDWTLNGQTGTNENTKFQLQGKEKKKLSDEEKLRNMSDKELKQYMRSASVGTIGMLPVYEQALEEMKRRGLM